jgi:hypothetical protein
MLFLTCGPDSVLVTFVQKQSAAINTVLQEIEAT